VPVVLNLSKSAVLKPVWVPIDLRFGVTDQLEVFVSHTLTGGPIASGMGGLCLGGTKRNCEKAYNNVNIGGQFSIMKDAAMELAAIAALELRRISDPMLLAIDVGVNFKYLAGPLAIKAAPQVEIGANKRTKGNIEQFINVPVQIAFQATPELAAFIDTGIYGPTKKFGDSWVLPVGVGASFSAMPNLDVGGEFLLPRIASGVSGNKAFDNRFLGVFASYRTK